MVRLYGIVHSSDLTLYSVPIAPMRVRPSSSLFEDLKVLPKGSTIGVEWFSKKDWEDIRANIEDLNTKNNFESHPIYLKDKADDYWNSLIKRCESIGYKIVFLEDKETRFRYNGAIAEVAMIVKEGEEATFDGDKLENSLKAVEFKDRRYRAELLARKIHEVDRDEKLLENIVSNDIAAAIVGLGHSDFWIANKEMIQSRFRVTFDRYATETPSSGMYSGVDSDFLVNPVPNPGIVYSRASLERSLKIIDKGRITGATPDFVGLFNVMNPSSGYFEVYLSGAEGEKVYGTMEDALGSSTFEGTLSSDVFSFTKQYDLKRSTKDSFKFPIKYEGEGRDSRGGFYGYWYGEIDGNFFYMIDSQKENPMDLSRYWHEIMKKNEEAGINSS